MRTALLAVASVAAALAVSAALCAVLPSVDRRCVVVGGSWKLGGDCGLPGQVLRVDQDGRPRWVYPEPRMP